GPGGRPWRAYNFGVPTAGPMHEWLYLREMLDAGIRPRLLLLEFLPPLLGQPRGSLTSEENWTHAEWLSLVQLRRLRPYFAAPQRRAHDWLMGRLAPAYAFRCELQAYLHDADEDVWPDRHPHDDWGWRLPEEPTPKRIATVQAGAWNMYFDTLRCFRMGKGP